MKHTHTHLMFFCPRSKHLRQGKSQDDFRVEHLNSALHGLGLVSYEADLLGALGVKHPGEQDNIIRVHDQFWIAYEGKPFPAQVIDFLYGMADIPDGSEAVALTQTFDVVEQFERIGLNADDVEYTWSKTRMHDPDHLIFFDVDRMNVFPSEISCSERDFSVIEGLLKKLAKKLLVEEELRIWQGSDSTKEAAAECVRAILDT